MVGIDMRELAKWWRGVHGTLQMCSDDSAKPWSYPRFLNHQLHPTYPQPTSLYLDRESVSTGSSAHISSTGCLSPIFSSAARPYTTSVSALGDAGGD